MTTVIASSESWDILQSLTHEARVVSSFQTFRSHGIEPILIKGWAAARNYPPDQIRRSGDIDLAVAPADFDRAYEIVMDPELNRHLVDLHRGLRELDTVAWDDLFARSILVNLEETPVRVLCPEDHLRLLCVHWLLDGGRHRDKLWDIYYAVENRASDFDWERCLDVAGSNRRRWIVSAITIAHKYLGLEIDHLPFASESKYVPSWIFRCVEREWTKSDALEPILASTHDKRLLLKQVMRRLPPNPIRATVEVNGDLFGSRRWLYQAEVLGRRSVPFLKDLSSYLRMKLHGR